MKYKKVPGYVGIRKVLASGNYEAIKKINCQVFSKTFKTMKEAVQWRNTYNPFDRTSTLSKEKSITFEELWNRYEEIHFPSIERSSQGIKRQKIKPFFDQIKDVDLLNLTPDFLEHLIRKQKKACLADPFSKRFNFNRVLDELKAVLNWYRENYDYRYHNPVLKRHYHLGIMRKTVKKDKVLRQEQIINFFKAFDNPLFQDFALIQFFCAGRFGEIAGIQLKNIDLRNEALLIKEAVVEDQSKKFLELKSYPKNGHSRVVSISSDVFKAAIMRRLGEVRDGCSFLFHRDGNPLRYRSVQFQYNKALKRAGLYPDYSSTHFLRYSMATESRRLMGSLDAAQAVTGHHSAKMAEHYAKIPTLLQSEAVKKVGAELANGWERLGQLPVIKN